MHKSASETGRFHIGEHAVDIIGRHIGIDFRTFSKTISRFCSTASRFETALIKAVAFKCKIRRDGEQTIPNNDIFLFKNDKKAGFKAACLCLDKGEFEVELFVL